MFGYLLLLYDRVCSHESCVKLFLLQNLVNLVRTGWIEDIILFFFNSLIDDLLFLDNNLCTFVRFHLVSNVLRFIAFTQVRYSFAFFQGGILCLQIDIIFNQCGEFGPWRGILNVKVMMGHLTDLACKQNIVFTHCMVFSVCQACPTAPLWIIFVRYAHDRRLLHCIIDHFFVSLI